MYPTYTITPTYGTATPLAMMGMPLGAAAPQFTIGGVTISEPATLTRQTITGGGGTATPGTITASPVTPITPGTFSPVTPGTVSPVTPQTFTPVTPRTFTPVTGVSLPFGAAAAPQFTPPPSIYTLTLTAGW